VSFVSADPEALPWTTTKGGINVDNMAWQEATVRMAAVAKPVIRVLDMRYPSEGTDIQPVALAELSGEKSNVLSTTVSPVRTFATSTRSTPRAVRVQYDVKPSDIAQI